jgi:hypothetical protein
MGDTEPLVFPIGQYAGRFRDDAAGPWGFRVRRGLEVTALSAAQYLVWLAAHGSSARVAEIAWTRAAVLDRAEELLLPEPGTTYGELVDRGLVAEVEPDGPTAVAFAGRHQLVPLTYSLGNTAAEPDRYGLGFPPRPWLSVPSLVWWLWQDGHLEPSLWHACQAIVARGRRPGTTISSGMAPDRLLCEVLNFVHIMLSVHTIYLDLTRSGADRRP